MDTYKRIKVKQWSQSVSRKGKKASADKEEEEQELVIFIGLAEWNGKHECLKRKYGKRLALRVSTKDPSAVLKEKAILKWKAYCKDLYSEDAEYVLLLEDFSASIFQPGTNYKEFFSLSRYKEEMGKDYKRITLYLSTKSDYEISLLKPSTDGSDLDDVLDKPSTSGSCKQQNDTRTMDTDYALLNSDNETSVPTPSLDGSDFDDMLDKPFQEDPNRIIPIT